MFHSEGVGSTDRLDKEGMQVLKWAALPNAEEDQEEVMGEVCSTYDLMCR